MDENNRKVFEGHAQFFSNIGTSSESEPLNDFIMSTGGVTDSSSVSKSISGSVITSESVLHSELWTHSFNCQGQGADVGKNNTAVNIPIGVSPFCTSTDLHNSSSLVDDLSESIQDSQNVDQYLPALVSRKNIIQDNRPGTLMSSNLSNSIYSNLHLINVEKNSQSFLESFSKQETIEKLNKCSDYESVTWNGAICDPLSSLPFQSQNQLNCSPQRSVDKNGNTASFNSAHVDKISCIPNSFDHFSQNNFLVRLSPSASVETNVRTPATSYESASPLSNNRTPIRSDESISPMGSGHTPLRIEENSPMGRTSLCVEESFSPLGSGVCVLTSNSPSHKSSGVTSGFDNYSSSPTVVKKSEVKSPTSCTASTFGKCETTETIVKRSESEPVNKDTSTFQENIKNVLPEETKCFDNIGNKDKSNNILSVSDNSDIGSLDSSIKHELGQKPLLAFVSCNKKSDSIVNRKSHKRTLSRKSDEKLCVSSSLLSSEGENNSVFIGTEGVSVIKTENAVPEVVLKKEAAEKVCQSNTSFCSERLLSKSKKPRKKTQNISLLSGKRKNKKKVTIYQSSMSPEETGIKLKIKVSSAFQQVKRQKKRKSKNCESDEEESSESKRSKKIVRFSNTNKEPQICTQNEWGSKIPSEILQKIFQIVVDEQGCVPSLVR